MIDVYAMPILVARLEAAEKAKKLKQRKPKRKSLLRRVREKHRAKML